MLLNIILLCLSILTILYPLVHLYHLSLQCTQREYEEIPIEEFGKAMVRGMGWKEGEAIGSTNKRSVRTYCM